MKAKPGFYIGLMVVALITSACVTPRATDTLLHFTEQDRDGRVLATHMRVNREYLRMDDGAEGDFVLLDRGARMVYSVSAADQTILVIQPLPLTLARPPVFEQGIERDAAVFPAVAGRPVVHYRLLTNGKICTEVYAAAGLLPEVAAALREYHEIMAGEQAQTQGRMSEFGQSVCDLAEWVFAPARYLDQGFPVRQVSHDGRVRQLVDFKTLSSGGDSWHSLPQDYRRYSIGDMVEPDFSLRSK